MNSSSNTKSFLKKYAVLLNARAAEGKIDPVIGRSKEIENVITILAQRRKNNPMLVGDAGVGKTAIAEGLALHIVEKKVPKQLQDLRVYSVDMGALLAGTKFRGDFEDRLDKLIKEATKDPNIVLFIDEIHTIIGAGSAGGGTMDAANILKPSLSNGSLKVIGATTFDEYKKIFEKETALARRFQKIDIEEPSPEEAIQIINGLKSNYEEFHGLTFTKEAVEAAVNLTVKYLTDRKLPDKAIDMIDMAGAKLKLAGTGVKEVTVEHISEILAKLANIPVGTLVESEKEKLKKLKDNLKATVFGQEEAVEKVVKAVMLSRANLVAKDKPIASFLMAGPTGVGKTELARQVSKSLDIPLIRFDMSEYMDKHSVARLTGAPPGYVGHEEGGQLVNAVRKNPHCILLLDEIEKAHPDIFNIFLQVMDYGKLTDTHGKKADFKNVIIMLTSNAGATQISKSSMGFGTADENNDHAKDARDEVIKKSFKPEFINRIDAIVQFNPLSKENIIQVIDKQLNILNGLFKAQNIDATFTNEVKQFIADKAYDPKMGARPIERFIEAEISQALSEEIIWGKLENGGSVKVDTDGKKITFTFGKDIVKEILTTSTKKRVKKTDKETT
jgi:ATP-dependent Clp protease ATP-binding subunit ClpA